MWVLLWAAAWASDPCLYGGATFYRSGSIGTSAAQLPYKVSSLARRKDVPAIRIAETGGSVQAWPRRGVPPGAPKLGSLSLEALLLAYGVLRYGEPGIEYDVRLPVKGNVYQPATVIWSAEGLLIEDGVAGIPYQESGPTPDEIVTRYGLSEVSTDGEAEWTPGRLAMLDSSLNRLDTLELLAVRDLPFVRSDKNIESAGALYHAEGTHARILLLDAGLYADALHFAGSPLRPIPNAERVLLHEIAHAIHDAPALWAARAQVEAPLPVIDRYASLPGVRTGPTAYAKTSLTESFAEAFSLFKTDPKALKRCMPEVLAWFEAGEHTRELARAREEGWAP